MFSFVCLPSTKNPNWQEISRWAIFQQCRGVGQGGFQDQLLTRIKQKKLIVYLCIFIHFLLFYTYQRHNQVYMLTIYFLELANSLSITGWQGNEVYHMSWLSKFSIVKSWQFGCYRPFVSEKKGIVGCMWLRYQLVRRVRSWYLNRKHLSWWVFGDNNSKCNYI